MKIIENDTLTKSGGGFFGPVMSNHRPIVGLNMGMVNFGIDRELSALVTEGRERNFFHEHVAIGIISPCGRRVLKALPNICAGGFRAVECGSEEEPIFDIASITKFLLTLCTMSLFKKCENSEGDVFDESSYVWDSFPPLDKHVQHFADLRIEHLLTFTAKFNARDSMEKLLCQQNVTTEEFIHRLVHDGLEEAPGTSWHYCNHPSVLLGRILEIITGKPLNLVMKERIFDPLGMINTTYFPLGKGYKSNKSRIVPVGELCGLVHDPSARIFHGERKSIGSAGVFSTVTDLLRCLAMILDRGLSKTSRRIIYPQYVNALGKRSVEVGPGFGLGAGLWNVFRSGMDDTVIESDCGFFKLGHTGCIISGFPDHHCGVVILTDHLSVPGRTKADRDLYKWFAKIISISANAAKAKWLKERKGIMEEFGMSDDER